MNQLILPPEPTDDDAYVESLSFITPLILIADNSSKKRDHGATGGEFALYKQPGNLGNDINVFPITYAAKACIMKTGASEYSYDKKSELFQDILMKSKESIPNNPNKVGSEFLLMLEDGTYCCYHCTSMGAMIAADTLIKARATKRWVNLKTELVKGKKGTYYTPVATILDDGQLGVPDDFREILSKFAKQMSKSSEDN